MLPYKRVDRVKKLLHKTVSELIYELKSPNLPMITITDVKLMDNFDYARIFFSLIGDKKLIEKTEEYLMIGPIGSRNAILTSWKGENRVMVSTGCFLGSIDEFAKAVKDKHGETEFGKQYEDALKYISRKFKVK